MTDVFLYGPLTHPPVLEAVLGRQAAVAPASLADHVLRHPESGHWPALHPVSGGRVRGLHLRASDTDLQRLRYLASVLGLDAVPLRAETSSGPVEALVFRASQRAAERGWRSEDWLPQWGPVLAATFADVMALMDQRPAEEVARRLNLMLVRGASRVRAARPAPVTLRHRASAADVAVDRFHQPYAHFFAIEEYDLSYRRFDGRRSPQINRAVFVSGDAVTVLPYDSRRDRVLLIEQFRAGPMGRGDPQPWLLEAIAGRIDPGEPPEQAARREAVEEAGLTLGALERVAGYYPSPGAKSEYIYSYVALCDLPDGVQGVFGVEGEAEDIRGHLLDHQAFMALVASGEVDNAPLLLTALWLQRERPRLRALAAATTDAANSAQY